MRRSRKTLSCIRNRASKSSKSIGDTSTTCGARFRSEIATRLGFKDLKSLNAAIEKDPKLHPQSREQILEIYRGHVDDMRREMPIGDRHPPRLQGFEEPQCGDRERP